MSGRGKFARLILGGKIAAGIIVLFAGARVVGIIGSCGLPGCFVNADSYDDKFASFSKTDPKLVIYNKLRHIKLGLRQPRAIALGPDGKLYVAGDRAVEVYDRLNGGELSSFRLASVPYSMSIAPDGKVYIGAKDHIEVYDCTGKMLSRWNPVGGKAYLTSIAATKDAVFAADAGNRVVLKYDLGGRVVSLIGKKDSATGAPGFIVPSPHLDVAAAGGAVWVSNPGMHDLELYGPDGKLKRAWGKASFAADGFSGCCNPTDIALLPNGKFVTSEKGIPRVKVYSAAGKFEGVVAGFETFKPDVVGLDLTTDAQGHIFVLDPSIKCIRVYVAKGHAK